MSQSNKLVRIHLWEQLCSFHLTDKAYVIIRSRRADFQQYIQQNLIKNIQLFKILLIYKNKSVDQNLYIKEAY